MRPSYLPELKASVAQEFLNFDGTQISLLETSHRNQHYVKMHESATQQVRDFLKVPKEFSILWMQNEVELQYAAICMNLLDYDGQDKCTQR